MSDKAAFQDQMRCSTCLLQFFHCREMWSAGRLLFHSCWMSAGLVRLSRLTLQSCVSLEFVEPVSVHCQVVSAAAEKAAVVFQPKAILHVWSFKACLDFSFSNSLKPLNFSKCWISCLHGQRVRWEWPGRSRVGRRFEMQGKPIAFVMM